MKIYCLRNKLTGKCYVGQTHQTLEQRVIGHMAAAKSSSKYPLHEAIRQDGIDNFEQSILQCCKTAEELNVAETQKIKELNTLFPNGYNLNLGRSEMINTTMVTFRLDTDLLRKFDVERTKDSKTRTEMLTLLIKKWVEHKDL